MPPAFCAGARVASDSVISSTPAVANPPRFRRIFTPNLMATSAPYLMSVSNAISAEKTLG
jgi:hypothetical protein